MKRKMVILSLACLMALSGATGVHAEENLPVDESGAVSPLGKYEDPVTVEIVQSINRQSPCRRAIQPQTTIIPGLSKTI